MSESLSPGQVPEQPFHSLTDVRSRRILVQWRPVATLVAGVLLALAAMGAQPSLPGGFWIGGLGCGLTIWGLLSLLLAEPKIANEEPRVGDSPILLSRPFLALGLQVCVSLAATFGLLRFAVAGTLPLAGWIIGLALSATFLWLVAVAVRLARQLGFADLEANSNWWQHRGLWLAVLSTVLYLPGLGTFGLIDPWESHYGEVAREMLARRDWISLWWAEDGWFWSKPILDFWVQALSFESLGVAYQSDQMLAAAARGATPAPEWAARLPFFLFTLVGQHVLYIGVRLHLGRRPAFLGGLILATCPQWYFLARQSMVDMLYVAPLCAAMGLLLLALGTGSNAQVRLRWLRWRSTSQPFVVSGVHLFWGALLMMVVPQVLYLISRNVAFAWQSWPVGYFAHPDHVQLGSPDNCGLPGNRACGVHGASARALLQPIWAALIWVACAGTLMWRERRTRSIARLCYLGVWLFAALSFMGKGAPGLVLVIFTFLGTVVAAAQYRELRRCAPLAMLLVFACVAAPWFVQQYARLGFGFVERLFLHDMVKRAFEHVHDTNSGVDTSFRYYIWQLGYALFPWSGVAAVGSLLCIGRVASLVGKASGSTEPCRATTPNAITAIELLFVWQLAAFGMFSITGTKFHHYILPLVPPAAMLGGVFLSELWSDSTTPAAHREASWPVRAALILLAVGAMCWGLEQFLPGSMLGGSVPGSIDHRSATWVGGAMVGALGLGLFVWVGFRSRERANYTQSSTYLSLLTLAAAVLVLLVGRDLASRPVGDVQGQSRLLSLFCYTYTRDWPKLIDYSGWLAALGLVGTALMSVALVRRIRRMVVVGLASLAVIAAGWGINVYLPQLSLHWGQRATLLKYYERRQGPEEPVVAYQLNWKGENFYTGNHIAVFKVSGKKFKDWVSAKKKKGVKVMFFATEHARISTLQRELGKTAKLEQLTDKAMSSKFLMVRAEL